MVVVEEMLHLTIAANLLNAIGGTPDPTTPGFVPNYPCYLPTGEKDFMVHIAPFTHDNLQTFLEIERPRKGDGRLRHHAYPLGATVLGSCHKKGSNDLYFYSIGDFYAAIDRAFARLEAEARAEGKTIFTGHPSRQITSEYYYSGGGELHPVIDLKSAHEAIRLVMEQGEGTGTSIYTNEKEIAHYYRFDQLNKGRYYQQGDAPDHPSGPPLRVEWDAAYPMQPDLKLAQIPAGSEVHEMALAFNRAYGKFLETLKLAYNGDPKLLMAAVPQMFEFRNLMTQLIRNPLPDGSGATASPTFEINQPPEAVRAVAAAITAAVSDRAVALFTGASTEAPVAAAIVTPRLDRFLAFSSEVTSFTVFDLQGTGQAEAYLQTVDSVVGAPVVDELLAVYAGADRESGEQAREAYLRREIFGREKLGPIARNIVKLWYSGTWYELPSAWTEIYGPAPKDVTFVVSPYSYVEGLLWTAVGAHPAGAKAPGYASWAAPPVIPPVDGPPRRSLPVVGKR